MAGAAKETDSAQRIGTMLEEQMNRIAQIEEGWHKIDNGSSDNDTQHSTPAKSDESQGSSGLGHGGFVTSDDSNENDESQGSSVLEQSEVAASGGSNDNHQHDKILTPNSNTTINQVLIEYDKNPMTPKKRELDENGNLIPLPPATPPTEALDSPHLQSVSAEKVVDSDSTVNPSLLGDSPLSATYRSQSVKGSLRRPCRISKALKAAEVAGKSLGVKDTPQDTQVIEGIVIGPSNATQAVSCETRQTEIKGEFVEVADLGMSNGCDKSGNVAENDVAGLGMSNGFDESGDVAENDAPKADDIAKRNHEIDSGEGPDVEDGNMNSQHPREDTSDKAKLVGDTAVSDVPKTDDMAKGLNIENENMAAQYPGEDNSDEAEKVGDTVVSDVPGTDEMTRRLDIENEDMEAQHPEGDNDGEEKPDDTTGSDVPKMDEMAIGDGDMAGNDVSEPDDIAKGGEDKAGSDLPEPDDTTNGYDDVESDRGLPVLNETLEAQYLGEVNSDEADETAVSDIPKIDDMAKDVESGSGLDIEIETKETQQSREDDSNEKEKPGEAAVSDVPKTDDIDTGYDDIESDRGLDVKDWILWDQYSGEDVSDKEERPGDTVGSDVQKTEDHVEEQDDVEDGSGLGIEDGSMEKHPREGIPDKEVGSSNTAGSVAPETENIMEEHEDIKNGNGLDIKDECMEAQSPEDHGSDEGKKAGDKVVTDMLVDEGVAEEQVMTSSHEGSGIENEETVVQHPGKINIAGKVDFLRDFASRGLALLMVAKGFEEQGGVGSEQKAVEPPVAKKVDVMVCCNQSSIERGLALLMEAMDANLGI